MHPSNEYRLWAKACQAARTIIKACQSMSVTTIHHHYLRLIQVVVSQAMVHNLLLHSKKYKSRHTRVPRATQGVASWYILEEIALLNPLRWQPTFACQGRKRKRKNGQRVDCFNDEALKIKNPKAVNNKAWKQKSQSQARHSCWCLRV